MLELNGQLVTVILSLILLGYIPDVCLVGCSNVILCSASCVSLNHQPRLAAEISTFSLSYDFNR